MFSMLQWQASNSDQTILFLRMPRSFIKVKFSHEQATGVELCQQEPVIGFIIDTALDGGC